MLKIIAFCWIGMIALAQELTQPPLPEIPNAPLEQDQNSSSQDSQTPIDQAAPIQEEMPQDSQEITQVPLKDPNDTKHNEKLRAISPQKLNEKIKLCEEKDDKKTCFQVGMLYYQGLSIYGQKLKEALYYFDRSCDPKEGLGCYEAGLISAKYQQYQYAFIFLDRSCQSGDLRGCKNLGILYYNGWGTNKDVFKATQLFSSGCKQGDKSACQKLYLALGNAYQESLNYVGAKKSYKKACELGEKQACEKLRAIEIREKQTDYENTFYGHKLRSF